MRSILVATLLVASLVTCLVASKVEAGECRGGSCGVARFDEPRLERIRGEEHRPVQKARGFVRWAVRGR